MKKPSTKELEEACDVLSKRVDWLWEYFPSAKREREFVEGAITSLNAWKMEVEAEKAEDVKP